MNALQSATITQTTYYVVDVEMHVLVKIFRSRKSTDLEYPTALRYAMDRPPSRHLTLRKHTYGSSKIVSQQAEGTVVAPDGKKLAVPCHWKLLHLNW